MVLIPQTIDIPFGLGIDQRTDEKIVMPGKLVTLENAVFDKIGRVAKRPGVAAMPASANAVLSGSLYSAEKALAVRESLGGNAAGTADLISAKNQLQAMTGATIFTKLETDQLAPMQTSGVTSDGALDVVGKQVGLFATVDANGVAQVGSFDFSSKLQLSYAFRAGLTFSNARVLPTATAGVFLVGLYNTTGSGIYIFKLNVSGGTITGQDGFGFDVTAAQVNFATVNATPRWDWCLNDAGTALYLVTLNGAGTTATITRYDTTTWAATSATQVVAGVTSLGLGLNNSNSMVGFIFTTAAGATFASYNPTTMALVSGPSAMLGTAGTYELCTICGDTNTTGFIVHIQENFAPAATYNRRVVWSAITISGTGFAAKYMLSTGLASKMAKDSRTIAITYDSPLQQMLLFRQINSAVTDTLLQGRTLYGRHAGLLQNHCVPYGQDVILSSLPTSSDFFTVQLSQQVATATAAAPVDIFGPSWVQAQQPAGVSAGTASGQNQDRPYPSASFAGKTIFGGGLLHRLGSRGIGVAPGAETIGLLAYPVIVSTAQGVGGSLADGQYGVICTYERIDQDGNVWESAPSVPVFQTIAAGGGTASLQVTASNYRLESMADVYLVYYRTLPGGSTYYRERRQLISPSITSSTLSLLLASTALDDGAIGYWQGEQENAWPDGPSAIAADQDRLWIVAGSSRNRVSPSKPFTKGIGISFFPDVYRQVASQGEAINALARQDQRLFAFKDGTTHISSGAGPDVTGNNDDLSEFSELFNNVGAERCNSVLKAPLGMYVKNSTDIWHIGRDLQLSRIGADVETSIAGAQLLSSAYCTAKRQARFLFGVQGGTTFELVFDDEKQQWIYHTRPAVTSAGSDPRLASLAYFGGTAYYVFPLANTATPCLFREDGTVFTDNGSGYSLKLVTAWLKPAQVLQGFGAIFRATLLGESLATHTLQVRVRYDYETAWVETHTISSANATEGGTAYQPVIDFERRKCEAFQLEIMDVSPTGQAFSLSGLELEVGVESRSYRTSAGKRF